jgi:RNA polymerase primary sigma factor
MRQLKIEQSITKRDSMSLNAYFTELNTMDMISADEEVELAQRIKKGDEIAFQKLVKSNLRFVVSVAKQYQNFGVSLNDLINEGNIGLMKAARKFDETKGFKFISYAVWWIRQSIHNAIQQKGKLVRLPANKAGLMLRIRRAEDQFIQQNERKPDAEELAQMLDMNESAITSTLSAQFSSYSLDEPVAEDSGTSKIDLFESDEDNNIDSEIERSSLRQEINRLLGRLNNNERTVLSNFYGLGTDSRTLSEISSELHLSKERIRQIKSRALKKLNSMKGGHLQSFV